MNIDQWIADLDQAKSPGASPALINQHRARDTHATWKARRSSGKSSLLEPFFDRTQNTKNNRSAVTLSSDSKASSTTSASSSSLSFDSTSLNSSSGKKYQKRRRHRTKADKYHSKAKRNIESADDATTKKKRRKKKDRKHSHDKKRKRQKSEAPRGIVQSFRASNVSKNRLTLDVEKQVGLYKKGRSSGPIKGKGLPDLVFSEMKFLQKPEDMTKDEQDRPPKGKHKKKRRELDQEEVSRYFEPSRVQPGDGGAKDKQPLDAPGLTEPSVVVELPEKPFLGFGSRGTHATATSCYTWSQSGRASVPPAKYFTPSLGPLKLSQLQGGVIQAQEPITVAKQGIVQCSPVQQLTVMPDAQRHDQTCRLSPIESQSVAGHSNDGQVKDGGKRAEHIHRDQEPHAVSESNLAEQDDAKVGGVDNVHVDSTANMRLLDEGEGDGMVPTSREGPMRPARPELMEELLVECEHAAQPLLSAYRHYDTPFQYTSHGHIDLGLWRTDGRDYSENYQLHEQTEPMVYWEEEHEEDELLPEDVTDDASNDSLDSNLELNTLMAIENGMVWGDGDSVQTQQQRHADADAYASDELAGFWQPNRLY